MKQEIEELQKIAAKKKISVKDIVKSVRKVRAKIYDEEYGA